MSIDSRQKNGTLLDMEFDPHDFGRKLVALRRHKLWTQPEAAERIGVSLRSYSRWEKGHGGPPHIDNINACAKVFGVDPTYFGVTTPEPGQLDRIEQELAQLKTLVLAITRDHQTILNQLNQLAGPAATVPAPPATLELDPPNAPPTRANHSGKGQGTPQRRRTA